MKKIKERESPKALLKYIVCFNGVTKSNCLNKYLFERSILSFFIVWNKLLFLFLNYY